MEADKDRWATSYGDQKTFPKTQHNQVAPITQQPGSAEAPQGTGQGRDWSTGLFGCFGDIKICLCGAFCVPCLTYRLTKKMEVQASCPGCCPYWQTLRLILRHRENIHSTLCYERCAIGYCPYCALCQFAREVKFCEERDRDRNSYGRGS